MSPDLLSLDALTGAPSRIEHRRLQDRHSDVADLEEKLRKAWGD